MRLAVFALWLLTGCVNLAPPAELARDVDARPALPDATLPAGPDADHVLDARGPAPPDTRPSLDAAGPAPADSAGPAPADSAEPARPDAAPMADAAAPPPDAAVPADGRPAGSCSSAADCKETFECVAGACKGPALHWRFDEAGGSTALDSSGNDLHGTYLGTTDLPAASTSVPPLELTNPASRAFVAARRHQVRLGSMPALLRPANGVTVSAWFRTRVVDATGYSLIVNGDDGYFIVIDQTRVWLARGVAAGSWVYCSPTISNHIDGNWHHVAGVLDASGMRLYFDGIERCSTQRGDRLVYDGALGVLVARRGVVPPSQQFEGNIDDVRVYTRVLTAAQILTLARGRE